MLTERPAWMRDAACVGIDMNLFFPPPGLNTQAAAAKRICAECPVRELCLEYALSFPSGVDGVWGGTSGRQRNAILRHRRLLNIR